MIKRYFYLVIISLTVTAIPRPAQGQPGNDNPPTGKSLVDLNVILKVDSIPANALYHTTDSTIYIKLFQDAVISQDPVREASVSMDSSLGITPVVFKDLSVGKYSILIIIPRYDIKYIRVLSNLRVDSTLTAVLKPENVYNVEIAFAPMQYSLYVGYLKSFSQKEPSTYSNFGSLDDPEMIVNSFQISILGRQLWKIKFGKGDEESEFVIIDKDFNDDVFRVKNPFITRSEYQLDALKITRLK